MRKRSRGGFVRRFSDDTSGNMLILSALSMPVIIGFAGLALEYGSAVALRAQNQRTSDLSAYAGAVAYSQKQSETDMRAAALGVVAINGGDPAKAKVRLIKSPIDVNSLAVRVDISGERPSLLSSIMNDVVAIPVSAGSTAIVGKKEESGGGPCIVALDPAQSGIVLSGGTKLDAPKCDIASNAALKAPCGTGIAAKKVTYGSTIDYCIWDNNVKETVAKQTVTDPLAGHAGIAAAWSRVASVNSLQWPVKPPLDQQGGKDINFTGGWNQSDITKVQSALPAGCTATWSQPRWTVNCSRVSRDSLITFGTITVGGGVTLEIDPDDPVPRRYVVNGRMETGSSGMFKFNGGSWTIRDGFRLQGSASATFGAGEYVIGSGYYSGGGFDCGGGNKYSVCVQGSGSLIFAGPSTFNFGYGILVEGSTVTELGAGENNYYHFGNPITTATSVAVNGSAKLRTGNISASNGFRIKGDVVTGGGSCISFGSAAQHDVDGSMTFGGGVQLGAGEWIVNGRFALGMSGGGNVNCFGQDMSLSASDVTIVLSGKGIKSSGNCADTVFCATAGYRNATLTAPASGANAGVAVIGPQNASVKNGALFAAGASSAKISGAFYFPNGPLDLSGGAGVGGGSGACFQAIASRVTLSGGTTAASNCVLNEAKGSAGSNKTVRIVR